MRLPFAVDAPAAALPPSLAAVTALALLGALAGCGTYGPRIGPPDLDTSSPAAPRCQPQVYPPRALIRGDRGTAVVRAQVSADGTVRTAALTTSTLDDDLDVQSVAAVRRCRFEPAPTDAAATSGELRPVDVLVVWELLPGFGTAVDRPVVRIGVRPPGARP